MDVSRSAAIAAGIAMAALVTGCGAQSPVQPSPVAFAERSLAASAPDTLVQGAATSTDHFRARVPVSFELSGCPSLPGLTVRGEGEARIVFNERIGDDGVSYGEGTIIITGRATDDQGGAYVFNYHNHSSDAVPLPAIYPYTVQTTDHFNLVGNGRANKVQVGFVQRVTALAPNVFIVEEVNVRGNPELCDAL